MEIREIVEGLKKPGKTKSGLAKALGRQNSAVTSLLKGGRRVQATEVPVIRAYLELEPVVPIVGSVGASDEAHYYGEGHDPDETTPAPSDSSPDTVAVEIRGESLGPGLNGWVAFYDDSHSPVTSDQIGRLCVVGLDDGRILVKVVKPARAKDRFHLYPNAGGEVIPDVKVLWAARVTGMRPK